jgi:hypothetical protein
MIQEDAGVDRILGGLLNISVVIVHGAASAIGTSVSGFLLGSCTYTNLDGPDELG